MNQAPSRRQFIKQTALAAGALPLLSAEQFPLAASEASDLLAVHIFSKHLQFLSYDEAASVAAELGFSGVDWSVRPKGHVLPERVEMDLPNVVEAMKKAGFSPLMMTTAVNDSNDATDRRVLQTAAKLGFQHYRMNWYSYPHDQSMPDALQEYGRKMAGLGQFNKELGLVGGYENHAGELVGASVWELWEMLKNTDPAYMGVQYDIRHATVEGGLSWKNGLQLLKPHIKTITLKDFHWVKKNGRWEAENVPIGEGMIDFTAYFRLLKQYKIQVPVSLHAEYPLGGAENGATKLTIDKKQVFDAIKRDLGRVRELWQAA